MAGAKTPKDYETVTQWTQDSHPAPEGDIEQLRLFKEKSVDLTHTGPM